MLPEMKRQLLGGCSPSASVAAATTTSNTSRDHSRLGRDTRGGRTMGDIWCEILLHVGFRSCRQTNGVKKALMEEISVNQSGDVLKSTGRYLQLQRRDIIINMHVCVFVFFMSPT